MLMFMLDSDVWLPALPYVFLTFILLLLCMVHIYMYKLYFYVYQRNQVCWSRGPKEQDWGNTAVVTDRLGAKYKSFSMMGMFPVALKTYEANKNNLCKVVFLVQYISTFLEIIKCATIMLHVACVWRFHLPFCYQSVCLFVCFLWIPTTFLGPVFCVRPEVRDIKLYLWSASYYRACWRSKPAGGIMKVTNSNPSSKRVVEAL